MSIVGRGARFGVRATKKGGIKGTKTEDTNGTGNALAQERDPCRHTGQRPKSPSKNSMIGGTRN